MQNRTLASGERRKTSKGEERRRGKRRDWHVDPFIFLEEPCVPGVGASLRAKQDPCSKNFKVKVLHDGVSELVE